MLGSTILETAIGVVFIYLLFSLFCSAIREGTAWLISTRAENLEKGLLQLLKDPAWVKQILGHHLVRTPLDSGEIFFKETRKKVTAMTGSVFSHALVDTLADAVKNGGIAKSGGDMANPKKDTVENLRETVNSIENHEVKQILSSFLDNQVKKDFSKIKQEFDSGREKIEKWFDASMTELSNWYRRQTRWVMFLMALVICPLFNLDFFMIGNSLMVDPALRQAVVNTAIQADLTEKPQDTAATFEDTSLYYSKLRSQGLPIGWAKTTPGHLDPRELPQGVIPWIYKILGLLISVLAVSMGAPFWFDILRRLANLRGSPKKK